MSVIVHGLNPGGKIDVVVLEAKTGRSGLNGNQRRIRDAIRSGRVFWPEVRVDTEVPELPRSEPSGFIEVARGDGNDEQHPDSNNVRIEWIEPFGEVRFEDVPNDDS
jgi:hypothetical protein